MGNPTKIKGTIARLKILTHPVAISILDYVREHEKTPVANIYKGLKLEQSVTSSFLAKLRKSKFVIAERNGKQILYSLYPTEIDKVFTTLSEYFNS